MALGARLLLDFPLHVHNHHGESAEDEGEEALRGGEKQEEYVVRALPGSLGEHQDRGGKFRRKDQRLDRRAKKASDQRHQHRGEATPEKRDHHHRHRKRNDSSHLSILPRLSSAAPRRCAPHITPNATPAQREDLMPTPKKMNQTEAAAHFGVTRQRLQNLEKEGWIQRDARKRYSTADLEAVFANMNPAVRANGKRTNGLAPQDAAGFERALDEELSEIDAEAQRNADGIPSVHESKRAYEHWRAELARTKALEAQGALVSLEEVESVIESAGLILRSQVMSLAADLKPYITDSGQAHLDNRLRSALEQTCEALMKAADGVQDEDDAAAAA